MQHCVENHKHQKLLVFNIYNIPINLFQTNVPTETIHLVCLNQITGFYMNEILLYFFFFIVKSILDFMYSL